MSLGESLHFMLLPMLACLLLAGIHGYLGIHVLSRGIIFVDLAMAQIAALGAAVAVLFGLELHGGGGYFFSILFTTLGAGVLAVTTFEDERVPHEAIIGVVYVVSAALVILVMEHAPHGMEHVKDLLVGHILWVSGKEVAVEAVIYGVMGILLGLCSSRIHLISQDRRAAQQAGIKVALWDFIFYSLFGVIVTVSVRLAGVLLVFSFLVVPAIIAFLFAETLRSRLAIAWFVGALSGITGCVVSFYADWPTGQTVVAVFGAFLLVAAGLYRLKKRGVLKGRA